MFMRSETFLTLLLDPLGWPGVILVLGFAGIACLQFLCVPQFSLFQELTLSMPRLFCVHSCPWFAVP